MSQENVARIGRFLELFNRREINAWLEIMATDVEWHVDPQDPDTTVHRGREAARRYALNWIEMMESLVQVSEVFEGGDQVVAWTRINSRGGASGVLVGLDLAFVFTLRDGLVVRIQETQDRAEALEAAGLSEQDVHADS
jgi:ketosteroid isomerase-like protein